MQKEVILYLSFGIFAALTAQIMNTISSLYSKNYYYQTLLFAVFCQLIIGVLLIKYYGKGIKFFHFSLLAVFYYGFGTLFSIFFQFLIFKQDFKINELISIFLIISGIITYFLF